METANYIPSQDITVVVTVKESCERASQDNADASKREEYLVTSVNKYCRVDVT